MFTDRALTGNQLAVVLDAGDIAPDVIQKVARETPEEVSPIVRKLLAARGRA